MSVMYTRCAGLDVHRDTVAACIRTRLVGGEYQEQRETFGTCNADLRRLACWLRDHQIRQVAMESTGVYWIPIWNTLEASRYRFQPLLVNPVQVRALAGRKTDQIDCGRIAEYLQHGRLAGSFIPPPVVREARALERYRVHLQQDRNRAINRIERLLQSAGIKLSTTLSNIVGLSGRRILAALAQGQSDRAKLAQLVHDRVQASQSEIMQALEGDYSEHFRYMLGQLLEEYDRLTQKLEEITGRLATYMAAHAELVQRMCQVPGVDKLTAWTVLAEVGSDLSAFPDAAHFVSWVALCPGNNESAGKRKQGRTRKGNCYLRRALVQAAWAAAHSKGTYLSALFLRFARRQGMKKAAVSVAHRILVILYYIIRDGVSYLEKGDDYFDRQHPERTARRLLQRLDRLGYETAHITPKGVSPERPVCPPRTPRRGRPCKCAERGLACPHASAVAPQPDPKKEPDDAAVGCRMCAVWHIRCIHVRPKIKRRPKPAPPPPHVE